MFKNRLVPFVEADTALPLRTGKDLTDAFIGFTAVDDDLFDVGRKMVADHAHDQIGFAVQEGRLLSQGVTLADTVPRPQQILKVT